MRTYFASIFQSAALLAIVSHPVSVTADEVITDFESSDNEKLEWRIVNDGVMGGLSQGKVSFSKSGTMRFQGNLSLENNGGFSSVRTSDLKLDLSSSEGIALRVKGDGRTYQLRLSTDARYRSSEVSFKADFATAKGEWREVQIPFSSIAASWRGRELDNVFDPRKIERVSLFLGDKKPGPFKLEVDWIRAYEFPDDTSTATNDANLVETAIADGRFETLATFLAKAELLDPLQGDGPLTVFAPTDAAFAKLPKETLAEILEPSNQDKLQSILKYHVISGAAKLSDALSAGGVATLQGESVSISFKDSRVRVNEASLVDADIECSNGVIHVIDTVLLPPAPQPKTILETAAAAGSFSKLLAGIDAAGLTSVLDGEGPFTVFAPTDSAVDLLPEASEALLLAENRDQLKSILTYHVIKGRVSAGDALNAGKAESVNGKSINFAIRDGQLKANNATIRAVDIACANGVIHVIDTVLIPTDNKQAAVNQPTASTRILLAIDKGVPLFNHGQPGACANVYQKCAEDLLKDTQICSEVRQSLVAALDKAKTTRNANTRAWLLRQNLDSALLQISASVH